MCGLASCLLRSACIRRHLGTFPSLSKTPYQPSTPETLTDHISCSLWTLVNAEADGLKQRCKLFPGMDGKRNGSCNLQLPNMLIFNVKWLITIKLL